MRTEPEVTMRDSMVPKLDRLLANSRWRETLLLATQSLEDRLEEVGYAADHLDEEADHVDLPEVLIEVRDKLKQVWTTLLQEKDASEPVIRLLSRLRDWEGVLEAAKPTRNQEISWLRAAALRSLGRQDEALAELEQLSLDPADTDHLRLYAALLCDVGDFEGALLLLRPSTEPLDEAPESILTLRGWAHQNCEGQDHAAQAEHVYRHALGLNSEDYWSRKGLANALRRLGRLEEANAEYERVVEYAKEQRDKNELDPYDACLAGWCCYCLNRPKEGADFSSTGLATVGVGSAAQFDYGLMLLADLQFDAAMDQFEWSIECLSEKNALRRCGLLYVALTDLADAINRHHALAKAPESYLIQKELTQALEEALLALEKGRWTNLKDKMCAFLGKVHEEDHLAEVDLLRRLAGKPEEVDWSEMEVRGFINDAPKRPIALFLPLVSHKRLPKVLYSVSEAGYLSAVLDSLEDQGRWNPESGIYPLARRYPAFRTSRVLWVVQEVLEALTSNAMSPEGLLSLALKNGDAWEAVSTPNLAKAAVSQQGPAEVVLDELATQFTSKANERLLQHFQQYGEKPCEDAARLAEYAFAAAVSDTLRRAALLAFGAAGGTIQSPQITSIQPGVASERADDFAELERDVEDFKKRSLWRAQMTLPHGNEGPQVSSSIVKEDDEKLSPSEKLRKSILARARSIAEIGDEEEQNRLAAKEATEVQSLIPFSGPLEELRSRLAEEMNTKDQVCLESADSVFLMGREPAFYAPRVLLKTDPPLVHTFNFRTQTRRMRHAGIPIPSTTLSVA